MKCWLFIFVAMLAFAHPRATDARDEPSGSIQPTHDTNESLNNVTLLTEPYCGLFAVYGASKLLNVQVEWSNLVKPEFVGSQFGSSVSEVENAARSIGLFARTYQNVNPSALSRLKVPAILYLRSSPQYKTPDHFVLLAGTDSQGELILVDQAETGAGVDSRHCSA